MKPVALEMENAPHPSQFALAVGVGVALLSVSSAALFIRFAKAPPLAISFWRCCAGAVFFAGVFFFRRLKETRAPSSSRTSFSKPVLFGAALAGFFLAAHFATWITSLFYTSVAVSVVLVCTQPLFVTLFSTLWLKERTTPFSIFGMVIAFAGTIGIAAFVEVDAQGLKGMSSWKGPFFALLGAVFVAGYMLVSRRLRSKGVPLISFAAMVYASAALVLGGASMAFGQDLAGYSLSTWGWILCLTIFPQILGHTLLHWALAYVPAPLLSSFILLEPVLATLLAWLFLAEQPGWLVVLFGSQVLVGLGLMLKSQGAIAELNELNAQVRTSS